MFRNILALLLVLCLLVGCSVPVEPIPDVASRQPAGTAVTSDSEPRPSDVVALPQPTTPTAVVQRRSRLAFAERTRGPGDPDLVIIDGQTRQEAQEIALPGLQTSPTWAPDGQTLAFVGTQASADPNDCVSGYVEFRCNFDIYAETEPLRTCPIAVLWMAESRLS